MEHSLKSLALIALGLCFVGTAQAQAPTESADSTAAYINATLHKYPTLEFVASGCSGDEQTITISEDRRSLIIKQNIFLPEDGKGCGNSQTLTAPIFNLQPVKFGSWMKQAQHTAFYLSCEEGQECFRRHPDAHSIQAGEIKWFLKMTAPDKVSDRLENAIQHLLTSLLAEADTHIAQSDPFAKSSR